MVEAHEHGNARPHAHPHEDRLLDPLAGHDAPHIVLEIPQGEGREGLVRMAIGAQVHIDDLVEGAVARRLIEPQAPIEGIGVDEDHGGPLPLNLVMDGRAGAGADGHGVTSPVCIFVELNPDAASCHGAKG